MNQNEKIDYNEIARVHGAEECERVWRLNNPDKLQQKMNTSLTCPCCGQHTFSHLNFYEFCPVCDWQDDPVQRDDPDYIGGANKLSLKEYQAKWTEMKTQRQYAEIVKLFNSRTPLDKIADDVGKSIDTVKSFLIQCGYKEVAN